MDLAAVRSSNRFELKFVITAADAARLADELQPWMKPDDSESGRSSYRVTSLYYDTPGLRCYWEKIDGIKTRHKVRLRRYGEHTIGADDAVFVEIKSRYDRVGSKHRLLTDYRRAVDLCDRLQPDSDLSGSDLITAQRVETLLRRGAMGPVAITSYHRDVLVGSEHDPGMRVTFDRDLRCSTRPDDFQGGRPRQHLLAPHAVVVEVKVNDRLPRWFSGVVARRGLRLVRLSKYAQAIERSAIAPTSRFHIAGTSSLCLDPGTDLVSNTDLASNADFDPNTDLDQRTTS